MTNEYTLSIKSFLVMKMTLLAALTAMPFLTRAQAPASFVPVPDNGVYRSASDFSHHRLADGFDNNQTGYRLRDREGKHIVSIRQGDQAADNIPMSTLWGQRVNDVDYRLVDGDQYKVEHADRIYVYSRPANADPFPQTAYFFSRTPDSPLYSITTDNLNKVYYDQPDKKGLFDAIDRMAGKPVEKAIRLTQLFYSPGVVPAETAAE
ncbi:hypothetical protein GCM10027578_22620 [Spirosoma luteolum]